MKSAVSFDFLRPPSRSLATDRCMMMRVIPTLSWPITTLIQALQLYSSNITKGGNRRSDARINSLTIRLKTLAYNDIRIGATAADG